MSSELTIAISGKSGCGNTTVSTLLAQRLGLRLINYTFHTMAEERGVSFEEICRLAEQDDQYDLHLDRHQVELASGALISSSTRQQLRGTIIVQGLPVPMEVSGASTIRLTAQSVKE